MYQDTSTAIPFQSPAHIAFQSLDADVCRLVQKHCGNLWNSISYLLRGTPTQDMSTKTPTIIIFVPSGTKYFWHVVEDEIRKGLEVYPEMAGIDLEILPGKAILLDVLEMAPSRPEIYRLPDILTPFPKNGSSIGPRGSIAAGSVGPFVHFTPAGKTEKILCFLICYHVVRLGDPANLKDNDENGIGLNGQAVRQRIVIEYPAKFDADPTMKSLRAEIAAGQDQDGEKAQVLKTIESYRNDGVGYVIHGSGMQRRNANFRRMDWALVRMWDSKAKVANLLPPRIQFQPNQIRSDSSYNAKPGEVVRKIGDVKLDEWATKVGRTTGITAGEVNAIDTTTVWTTVDGPRRATKETPIVNMIGGNCFVLGRDSGAMVCNGKKEWVGMAIGMMQADDVGFVSDAQSILDDIKSTTGGTVALI